MPWREWLFGSILFADISGFTGIAEALSMLGSEGAETLSNILNRYFTQMIGIVHGVGGDVMKFGGDALLCFFPGDLNPQRALTTAAVMMNAMHRFERIRTEVKTFSLQMKVGVAHGKVLLSGVGDAKERYDFVIAGEAVELASEAERRAAPGQIILARRRPMRIPGLRFEPLNNGFFRVHPGTVKAPLRANKRKLSARIEVRPYLIPEVHRMITSGYASHVGTLQKAVPVFVQFSGFAYTEEAFDLQRFQDFFIAAAQTARELDGRLNGITVGDKGSTLYVLFGAPNQMEEKEKAACQWAIQFRSTVENAFCGIRLKIGITSGRVFAGIVGGSGRHDYAIIGDAVNLASRLMDLSAENQISISREIQEAVSNDFKVTHKGTILVKGKTRPVERYELQQRIIPVSPRTPEPRMVGRTNEIAVIEESLKRTQEGNAGMLVLEGEAGAGKTFIASHVLEMARKRKWLVVEGKSEFTRRSHAYTPWQQVFRSLFFPGTAPNLPQLRKILKEKDPALLGFLPWHAAFYQMDPKKEPAGYDPQTRKTLLHHQLCTLLEGKIRSHPTLIFLDDLHWFDSLSLELLSSVLNHLSEANLLILTATRTEWQKNPFVQRSDCRFLTINSMTPVEVGKFIETELGAAHQDLIDFVYEQTRGNPFFARQILNDLQKRDLVYQLLGTWRLRRMKKKEGANFSGENLIVAQLDRLTMAERLHFRTAACMGPTFSISILKKVLGSKFDPAVLQSLHQKGFFRRTDADWATFSHALFQEIGYYSIPIRIRRNTHRVIARAFESLFSASLKKFYPNLANHFRLAGMRQKAVAYNMSAAKELYRALSFPESRFYFQHCYELIKGFRDPRKYEVGLSLADNLIHVGDVQASLQLALELKSRAKKSKTYLKTCFAEFDARRRMGDYSYLADGLKLLQGRRSDDALYRLRYLLGATYFWKGTSDQAETYLKAVIQSGKRYRYAEKAISAHVFLSSICAEKQEFKEAFGLIEKGLALARKTGRFYQEMLVKNEWAGVLLDGGRHQDARRILLELLPLAEGFGDFVLIAGILINLGRVEMEMGNRQRSFEVLQEALKLYSSMGILQGKANALLLLGIASFYTSDYRKAYDHYLEATRLLEQTGSTLETPHAYYNLSEVCLKLNKRSEAYQWLEKGLRSFEESRNPQLARMYSELEKEIAQNRGAGKTLGANPKARP